MVALLKMPNRFAGAPLGPRPAGTLTLRPAPADDGAERRVFPRRECHTRCEGRRHDNTLEACQEPQVSLALRDLSLGGLSAISATPMQRGERVSVFFPPQGPNRGWDAYGRIVRCEKSSFGYRVAVEFDTLPAA